MGQWTSRLIFWGMQINRYTNTLINSITDNQCEFIELHYMKLKTACKHDSTLYADSPCARTVRG